MKINDQVNTVSSNLGTDATDMKIDEAGMTHIISVLTNLYEDPEMTVIREYYSNALDSHIGSGTDRKIEVIAPGYYDPTFIVQDYGVGMSEHDIISIYSSYGRSTKRDSNDQVGAFGLGCKSALSYANQFSVEAVKDGMKTLAIISRKESGGTEYTIVGVTPTDDPNGVRISVPVSNYNSFIQKMQDFFRFADPDKFTLTGLMVTNFKEDYNEVGPNLWVESRRGYGSGGLSVLMGGVRYPVSSSFSSQLFSDTGVEFSYGSNLLIEMPIGSVDLTPSRESLQETSRTKESVREIYEGFIKDSVNEIQSDVDTCSNLIMAKYTALSGLLSRGLVQEYDLDKDKNLSTIARQFTFDGDSIDTFTVVWGKNDEAVNFKSAFFIGAPKGFFSRNYSIDPDVHNPIIDHKYLLVETPVKEETFNRWTDRCADVGAYSEFQRIISVPEGFELSDETEHLDTTTIKFEDFKKEITKAEKKLNMTPRARKTLEVSDPTILRNTDVIVVTDDGIDRMSVKDLDAGEYTTVHSYRSKSDFRAQLMHENGIDSENLYILTRSHDVLEVCVEVLGETVIIVPEWFDSSKTPEEVKFNVKASRDDIIEHFVTKYTRSTKKRDIIRDILSARTGKIKAVFNQEFLNTRFLDPRFKAIQKDVKSLGEDGMKIAMKSGYHSPWSSYGADRFSLFFEYVRMNYSFLAHELGEIGKIAGVEKMFNIMYTENIKEEK